MAWPYEIDNGYRTQSLADFPSPSSDVLAAGIGLAWSESPGPSLLKLWDKDVARGRWDYISETRLNPPTKRLEPEEATTRIKDAGLIGHLKHTENMTGDELSLLIDEKQKELMRKSTVARAGSAFTRDWAVPAVSFLTGFADPVNVAAAFIPFVGPSAQAARIGAASSGAGRMAARARIGAIEGALGTAMLEPAVVAAKLEYQQEYKLLDSFTNVIFGAGLGAGLHSVAGLLVDRAARRSDFFKTTGVHYDQAYSAFVDHYRAVASEYGLNTDLRAFQSKLQGSFESGFFGDKAKAQFDIYKQDMHRLADDLGMTVVPTPEGFLTWMERRSGRIQDIRPREKMKTLDETATGVAVPPPELLLKQTVFEYPIPYDVSNAIARSRSFVDKADVSKTVVTLPVTSKLSEFSNTVPAEARQIAYWHAANQFIFGKVVDTQAIYMAYGVQKRMSEAAAFRQPDIQRAIARLTPKDLSVSQGFWGEQYGFKIETGREGPVAVLRPDGLIAGDRVEWSKFTVNQFTGPGATVKIKEVKGDKAFVEGVREPIPLHELKLVEPGPNPRPHSIEITWGDAVYNAQYPGIQFPAMARFKAQTDLLTVLRQEQKTDPAAITQRIEAESHLDRDLLYTKSDEKVLADALKREKAAVDKDPDAIPLPPKPDAPPSTAKPAAKDAASKAEPVPTPEEDARVVEADLVASQKAKEYGKTELYQHVLDVEDKNIAEAHEKAYFMEHYARCLLGS